MKIRGVVFDIGNVLIRWDPRNLYARMFDRAEDMERFLATVCTFDWNLRQDRGYPWAKALDEAVAAHPHYEPQIRAFRARWHEMLVGPVAENVALLNHFRAQGIPNYAITNFAADTLAESQVTFPFLAGFDGMIVSGTEGLLKPEPEIFQLLLDRYGLDAGEYVFIDDSAANIATARSLGFATIHYGLGISSARAFAQLGLPVPDQA